MKLFHGKRTVRRHTVRNVSHQHNIILRACIRAIFFGVIASLLLFAAGAAIFSAFPVPVGLTRPTASLIAGIGTAVTGAAFAAGVGRQPFLCGLGSGILAAALLAVASVVTGGLVLSDVNVAMQCVLVFSGMFGGTVVALRPERRVR